MRRPNRKPLNEVQAAWPRFRAASLVALFFALGALIAVPCSAQQHLRLDPPEFESGAVSFRATGFDPAAPRNLVLWRLSRGAAPSQAVRVGETRSDENGHFDFGQVPNPIAQGSLYVAPVGERPDGSRPLDLSPSVPGPLVSGEAEDPLVVAVVPALFEGSIELRDATTRRLIARRVVSTSAARSLQFDLLDEALPHDTDRLSVEQILDDGRRSESTVWILEHR